MVTITEQQAQDYERIAKQVWDAKNAKYMAYAKRSHIYYLSVLIVLVVIQLMEISYEYLDWKHEYLFYVSLACCAGSIVLLIAFIRHTRRKNIF